MSFVFRKGADKGQIKEIGFYKVELVPTKVCGSYKSKPVAVNEIGYAPDRIRVYSSPGVGKRILYSQ